MPHPDVIAEKSADGAIRSITIRWLESKGYGLIGGMSRRSTWMTPAITFKDIYRELTINIDGSMVAGNGLPVQDRGFVKNIPPVQPALKLESRFGDIDQIVFDRAARWWTGRQIPDHLLALVRHDGQPIYLSWSMLGPAHFQPVVTTLEEVFNRMRPLVHDSTVNPRRSALDDIFGDD